VAGAQVDGRACAVAARAEGRLKRGPRLADRFSPGQGRLASKSRCVWSPRAAPDRLETLQIPTSAGSIRTLLVRSARKLGTAVRVSGEKPAGRPDSAERGLRTGGFAVSSDRAPALGRGDPYRERQMRGRGARLPALSNEQRKSLAPRRASSAAGSEGPGNHVTLRVQRAVREFCCYPRSWFWSIHS
jgi:hypothetical protein